MKICLSKEKYVFRSERLGSGRETNCSYHIKHTKVNVTFPTLLITPKSASYSDHRLAILDIK